MMQFVYQYDKQSPRVVVRVPGPDTTLTEALEQFEAFLKAAGYSFDGQLDFVNDQGEVINA